MKKMLCYMLSSIFLLAILSSCESKEDEAPPPPTLSDLEGFYIGEFFLGCWLSVLGLILRYLLSFG